MGKRFMKSKKVFILLLLLLSVASLSVLTSANVYATEGGGNAYPLGAEDFMSGAVPPPGYYFINYFLYYSADELNNKDGDNVDNAFDVDAVVNTFRFIYVTKQKIFGGFWGVHMFVPLWYKDVTATTPGGVMSDDKIGLGDIIVDPFILSWHFKNWHLATGVDIYMPTGSYDREDFVNISRNYWTFEPIFAFTYISDGGFEVSSKFMYDFNTENSDSPSGDYQSGQEFHFDYAVGYKVSNWNLGVAGYYYKQITDDEINGQTVPANESRGFDEGFKGQTFAVGPAVKYNYKNMSFTLKYLWETAVEHRAEGSDLWFKFVYAF
jgi:hypothetical protein